MVVQLFGVGLFGLNLSLNFLLKLYGNVIDHIVKLFVV